MVCCLPGTIAFSFDSGWDRDLIVRNVTPGSLHIGDWLSQASAFPEYCSNRRQSWSAGFSSNLISQIRLDKTGASLHCRSLSSIPIFAHRDSFSVHLTQNYVWFPGWRDFCFVMQKERQQNQCSFSNAGTRSMTFHSASVRAFATGIVGETWSFISSLTCPVDGFLCPFLRQWRVKQRRS